MRRRSGIKLEIGHLFERKMGGLCRFAPLEIGKSKFERLGARGAHGRRYFEFAI
jgi:hypothetical protein